MLTRQTLGATFLGKGETMATEYEVERDEYKGHALIAFYLKGSRSRYPALSFGAGKAQVVLDIIDNLDLQADLQAFVEEHGPKPAVEIPSLDTAFARPAKKPRKARNVGLQA